MNDESRAYTHAVTSNKLKIEPLDMSGASTQMEVLQRMADKIDEVIQEMNRRRWD